VENCQTEEGWEMKRKEELKSDEKQHKAEVQRDVDQNYQNSH
jgi:hypothetical protein